MHHKCHEIILSSLQLVRREKTTGMLVSPKITLSNARGWCKQHGNLVGIQPFELTGESWGVYLV